MARRRTERMFVTHVDTGHEPPQRGRRPDRLIVEEPLSILLDGTLVATTMRTPGHDFELAVGFCAGDGLLAGAPVTGVRYCAHRTPADRSDPNDYNTVTVETGGVAPVPSPRLGPTSSSCGWCGSDQLDELCERLDPLPELDPIGLDVLQTVPEAVRRRQDLFDATGAVHGAAVFGASGEVTIVREDVGRHNAVDKVVGATVLNGGTAAGHGLFVSGRASVEMVQKAWAAGFGTLLSVSAPTALAVETARRARMTLVGFVRDDGFNIYAPGP